MDEDLKTLKKNFDSLHREVQTKMKTMKTEERSIFHFPKDLSIKRQIEVDKYIIEELPEIIERLMKRGKLDEAKMLCNYLNRKLEAITYNHFMAGELVHLVDRINEADKDECGRILAFFDNYLEQYQSGDDELEQVKKLREAATERKAQADMVAGEIATLKRPRYPRRSLKAMKEKNKQRQAARAAADKAAGRPSRTEELRAMVAASKARVAAKDQPAYWLRYNDSESDSDSDSDSEEETEQNTKIHVQGGVKYLVHNDIYVTTVDGKDVGAWNPDENTILFYDDEELMDFGKEEESTGGGRKKKKVYKRRRFSKKIRASKRNKSRRNKSRRNKSKRNKSKMNKSRRNKSRRNKSRRNKSRRNRIVGSAKSCKNRNFLKY